MLFSRPFAAFTSAIRIHFIFSFILLFKFGVNPSENNKDRNLHKKDYDKKAFSRSFSKMTSLSKWPKFVTRTDTISPYKQFGHLMFITESNTPRREPFMRILWAIF